MDPKEYNYASKYSPELNTPKDIFEFGEVTKMPFGTVKDMQYIFEMGVNWIELIKFVSEYKNITISRLSEETFFNWCKFRTYIENALNTIEKLEQSLMYETSGEDEQAGINDLAQYGVMIQIDELAKGDILKYDSIRAMPYDTCFVKLKMDKDIQEYNAQRNRKK
jgi:hypothetical protein